ncbi:hypothetical protein L291_3565 [Acinetobacter guillouiae MSP4-18]|uniref:hypothetical protein n=1 Tax=Acinetobacter guillouiae TaxID=106649 RepID=UPI0002D13A56|nr:hypothetical protein [Acinetobacter guillouiae]ENU56791.1 hypothetical protein F981_04299 [Acinetobacter guillouiae CIP 63.46]EPH31650.1 hypothetical protein L291_3565 [Acinetobacter guillouiae MSP4-18]KAB0623637.1 hypothetical protein F7P82_20470 [Acinetobacter guillouiae]
MELISGKEALIALANGEEVEAYVEYEANLHEWQNARELTICDVLDSGFIFRLKPRTISINGIEVPAPFEPKKGEEYFIIHPAFKHGYTCNTFTDAERHKDFIKYGAWRTLEEIRQVGDALRKVFKEPQQ